MYKQHVYIIVIILVQSVLFFFFNISDNTVCKFQTFLSIF